MFCRTLRHLLTVYYSCLLVVEAISFMSDVAEAPPCLGVRSVLPLHFRFDAVFSIHRPTSASVSLQQDGTFCQFTVFDAMIAASTHEHKTKRPGQQRREWGLCGCLPTRNSVVTTPLVAVASSWTASVPLLPRRWPLVLQYQCHLLRVTQHR